MPLHLLASLSLKVCELHRGVTFDEVNNSRADMGSVVISAADVTAPRMSTLYHGRDLEVTLCQGDGKQRGYWEMWSSFHEAHWK